MVEIIVSGALSEILGKMEKIDVVVKNRKMNGWALFQDDEEWIYETQQDEKVCPVCETYGYNRDYRGSEVPLEFPEKSIVEPTLVEPNVHDMLEFQYLSGKCRCYIWWKDHMFTLTERLGEEMLEVIS